MELDTGATVSLISDKAFRQLFPTIKLQPLSTQLHSYTGEIITVMGQMKVEVTYGAQSVKLPLIVVSGDDLYQTRYEPGLPTSTVRRRVKKYVVVNTHRGLFHYNRLPFGIPSAPGIFQRVTECLLRGLPGVIVYLDDILITGSSIEEHLATLEKVFQTLEAAGLKLKKSKCVFLSTLSHIPRTPY